MGPGSGRASSSSGSYNRLLKLVLEYVEEEKPDDDEEDKADTEADSVESCGCDNRVVEVVAVSCVCGSIDCGTF